MKFQAQAVLRRHDPRMPLLLAGVLVADAFYPATVQEAWGPLLLDGGLVALAPLTPVNTSDAPSAAALAMDEAHRLWSDGHAPGGVGDARLQPVPIDPDDAATIGQLIERMATANTARVGSTPSTPGYHGAARELERLALRVHDATTGEERVAEDEALERKRSEPEGSAA